MSSNTPMSANDWNYYKEVQKAKQQRALADQLLGYKVNEGRITNPGGFYAGGANGLDVLAKSLTSYFGGKKSAEADSTEADAKNRQLAEVIKSWEMANTPTADEVALGKKDTKVFYREEGDGVDPTTLAEALKVTQPTQPAQPTAPAMPTPGPTAPAAVTPPPVAPIGATQPNSPNAFGYNPARDSQAASTAMPVPEETPERKRLLALKSQYEDAIARGDKRPQILAELATVKRSLGENYKTPGVPIRHGQVIPKAMGGRTEPVVQPADTAVAPVTQPAPPTPESVLTRTRALQAQADANYRDPGPIVNQGATEEAEQSRQTDLLRLARERKMASIRGLANAGRADLVDKFLFSDSDEKVTAYKPGDFLVKNGKIIGQLPGGGGTPEIKNIGSARPGPNGTMVVDQQMPDGSIRTVPVGANPVAAKEARQAAVEADDANLKLERFDATIAKHLPVFDTQSTVAGYGNRAAAFVPGTPQKDAKLQIEREASIGLFDFIRTLPNAKTIDSDAEGKRAAATIASIDWTNPESIREGVARMREHRLDIIRRANAAAGVTDTGNQGSGPVVQGIKLQRAPK